MILYKKNAIVTGATRGIGKEIALRLAKLGANVAVCGRAFKNGRCPRRKRRHVLRLRGRRDAKQQQSADQGLNTTDHGYSFFRAQGTDAGNGGAYASSRQRRTGLCRPN